MPILSIKKPPPPKLEDIVNLSTEAEREISLAYPERHGYGMTEEEGKPFVKQMIALACREDHAQHEKMIDRCERVQVIGRDKMFSMSPEQVLLNKETMQSIVVRLAGIRQILTQEERDIYDEYYLDRRTQAEIAERRGVSQAKVSRAITRINTALALKGGEA